MVTGRKEATEAETKSAFVFFFLSAAVSISFLFAIVVKKEGLMTSANYPITAARCRPLWRNSSGQLPFSFDLEIL